MRHYSELGFADEENAKNYASGGPAAFFAGFSVMHKLVAQLIAETTPKDGRVLVLGAGGGHELKSFLHAEPEWRFAAVDPSPQMLDAARGMAGEDAKRVDWHVAYIPDAPEEQFDSATCLLTLHIIPDNGSKLEALKAIHTRLKPGGAFAIVDNCYDKSAPEFKRKMDRFIENGRRSGAPQEMLENVRSMNEEKGESISAEREIELLKEVGFGEIDLFFASLSWRGWIARAL